MKRSMQCSRNSPKNKKKVQYGSLQIPICQQVKVPIGYWDANQLLNKNKKVKAMVEEVPQDTTDEVSLRVAQSALTKLSVGHFSQLHLVATHVNRVSKLFRKAK